MLLITPFVAGWHGAGPVHEITAPARRMGDRTVLVWCLAQWQCLKLDRRAVTTIEYGLIAAMVAVVIVNGATGLGNHVSTTFNKISSEL